MADYWTTPKINWLTSDGIGYDDLNRIEANISANRDANFRKVQGFGYSIDNAVGGEDGVLTVFPGSCYSSAGIPIKMASNFVKNLTTWAIGNGAAYGGMASAVTVAAHTWYYAFVITDPTDGSTEIMFDDNRAGTNISSGTFTVKRFINSFKTGAAGTEGSFDLIEMYSTGDDVFINPNSMYADRSIQFDNLNDGNYTLKTLTDGLEGFALPALEVRAVLNTTTDEITEYGFVSTKFTAPSVLISGGIPQAEFYMAIETDTIEFNEHSADFEILIDSSRQVNMALVGTPTDGYIKIAVRGFHDERLN